MRPFAKSSLLALAFLVSPITSAGAVTITNDSGGALINYVIKLKRYDASGEHIRIRGYCKSACTVYLGARRYCVDRNASLSFHRASGNGQASATATAWMVSMYPPKVRRWIASKGGLSTRFITLSGAAMHRTVSICPNAPE